MCSERSTCRSCSTGSKRESQPMSSWSRKNLISSETLVGETKGTSYLPFAQLYERPVTTIRLFRETVAGEVAKGVEQIRFIGEVPHPGMGSAWDWWGQYESVCNHTFAELPIWAVCAYDTRTTSEAIIGEAIRAHPFITT